MKVNAGDNCFLIARLLRVRGMLPAHEPRLSALDLIHNKHTQ